MVALPELAVESSTTVSFASKARIEKQR